MVKVEKTNVTHVHGRFRQGGAGEARNIVGIVEETKGSGSDTCGSGVGTSVAGELLGQTVVEARANKALVRGPQAGHRLANGTKGVLH